MYTFYNQAIECIHSTVIHILHNIYMLHMNNKVSSALLNMNLLAKKIKSEGACYSRDTLKSIEHVDK